MASLDDVRALRERYEGALDEAQALREQYHREIVKLHRSGMTLREIADGLGVSHQRIHQIVSPGEEKRPRRRKRSVAAASVFVAVTAAVGGWMLATRGGQPPVESASAPAPKVAETCQVDRVQGTARPVVILTVTEKCHAELGSMMLPDTRSVVAVDAVTGEVLSMMPGADQARVLDFIADLRLAEPAGATSMVP